MLIIKYTKKILKDFRHFIKTVYNKSNHHNKLIYIIEGAGWSTDEDGNNIVHELKKIKHTKNLNPKTDTTADGYKNKILHFGTWHLFFKKDNNNYKFKSYAKSNTIILTIFHIDPKDENKLEIIKNNLPLIKFIHTSCNITKNKLVSFAIPAEKIIVIPLGVSDKLKPPTNKTANKKNLGLPENKIIIGSFQKDGNGWGEGLTPKLIKGPDIFCEVVKKLSKQFPIHILLIGPARGFVKQNLERNGISYTHKYFKKYKNTLPYWRTLDLYLITSRIEGGPKAILEAWANGVPLISTKIGMVPDIAQHNENILLSETKNIDSIYKDANKILNDKKFKEKLTRNGLKTIKNYSWKKIAAEYYQKLYS